MARPQHREEAAIMYLRGHGIEPNRRGLRSLTMDQLGHMLITAYRQGDRRAVRHRAFAIGLRRGYRIGQRGGV